MELRTGRVLLPHGKRNMQTPTLTRPKTSRRAITRLRPDDFSRLGLGPTEARVAVIRRAARQLTKPLVFESDPAKSERAEIELAIVLTSAYRLLDPRRREQLVERVQLLRAEPTPLRSHLLQQGLGFDVQAPVSAVEDAAERDDEQQADMLEHDWMLDSLAELRIDPTVGRRGSRNNTVRGRGLSPRSSRNNAPRNNDKHRTQMLEVARYLQSGRTRISPLTGILGGIGLLLAGVMLVLVVGWITGDPKQVQANLPEPAETVSAAKSVLPELGVAKAKPAIGVNPTTLANETPSTVDGSSAEIEFEPSAGKYVPTKQDDDHSDAGAAGSDVDGAETPDITESPSSDLNGSETASGGQAEPWLESKMEDTVALGSVESGDRSSQVPKPLLEFNLPLDPGLDLGSPVRHPLPAAELITQAKQKVRSLGLNQGSNFPIGKSSVAELWQQSLTAAAGSVDRLAIGLTAGQRAVLLGEDAMAMVISTRLAEQYEATAGGLGTMLLAGAAEEAVTLSEHERVVRWGLRISDYGLINEDFVSANEAARLATAAAAKHGDAELRSRLKQRRDSIDIAERMAATFAERPELTLETADPAFAWNAGRHLCNNRRLWETGLPWLAAGSDVRFASLASEELAVTGGTSAEELADIARRWLELSERRKGREQGSIRLHGRDLLIVAGARADVLLRLELQKEVEAIESIIPADLMPLSLEDASKFLDGESSTTGVGQRVEAIPPVPTSDPSTVGLVGRLFASGKDTGVVLRYPTSIPLPRSAFDEVLARAGLPGGAISIQFQGYIQLASPTTLLVLAEGPVANPADPGASLSVSVGTPGLQVVALRHDGERYSAKLDLPAGIHRVVWQVSGDQFATARLLLSDDRTGQAFDLRHDQASRQLAEQLPVRFNVDFRAR